MAHMAQTNPSTLTADANSTKHSRRQHAWAQAMNISIQAPFNGKRKSDVIKIGAELGVPFEFTWSCYRDGEKHCGKCECCVNRKKAFQEADVVDPSEYEA